MKTCSSVCQLGLQRSWLILQNVRMEEAISCAVIPNLRKRFTISRPTSQYGWLEEVNGNPRLQQQRVRKFTWFPGKSQNANSEREKAGARPSLPIQLGQLQESLPFFSFRFDHELGINQGYNEGKWFGGIRKDFQELFRGRIKKTLLVSSCVKGLNECQNSHVDLLRYSVQNDHFSSGYFYQKGSLTWF